MKRALTLPHANQRQEYENKAFHEYSRERQLVGYDSCPTIPDYLVGKVSVQAHARS